MGKRCFNCGISLHLLPRMERTKDHIPPQCLFVGFPEGHKVNRKTVPCCLSCHKTFSTVDELFRNVLGFAYDLDHGNVEITKVAVAQLLKSGQIIRSTDGAPSITVSQADIHFFLKRCFKAIYYKTYSEIFPEDQFEIAIIDENDTANIEGAIIIQQYITHEGRWDVSGNSDVFKYTIKRMAFDEKEEMITAPTLLDAELIGAIMIFLERYAAVVIAKKKLVA